MPFACVKLLWRNIKNAYLHAALLPKPRGAAAQAPLAAENNAVQAPLQQQITTSLSGSRLVGGLQGFRGQRSEKATRSLCRSRYRASQLTQAAAAATIHGDSNNQQRDSRQQPHLHNILIIRSQLALLLSLTSVTKVLSSRVSKHQSHISTQQV